VVRYWIATDGGFAILCGIIVVIMSWPLRDPGLFVPVGFVVFLGVLGVLMVWRAIKG